MIARFYAQRGRESQVFQFYFSYNLSEHIYTKMSKAKLKHIGTDQYDFSF